MRSEYEIWRDELAGKRRSVITLGDVAVAVLGIGAMIATLVLHHPH